MSTVIKTKDNTLIWIDATLSISEDYSGTVTSHPIQDGSVISDHVILNNTKLSISGVVSDYDFQLDRGILSNEFNGTPVTLAEVDVPVTVTYNEPGQLSNIVPEAISNLIRPPSPKVVVKEFERPMSGLSSKEALIKIRDSRDFVTVATFGLDNILHEIFYDFIITSLSFQEDPDTGEAINTSISFEKVKRVFVSTAVVPRAVSKGLEAKLSSRDAKGDAAGASSSIEGGSKADAKENPKELSSILYDSTRSATQSISDGLTRAFQ